MKQWRTYLHYTITRHVSNYYDKIRLIPNQTKPLLIPLGTYNIYHSRITFVYRYGSNGKELVSNINSSGIAIIKPNTKYLISYAAPHHTQHHNLINTPTDTLSAYLPPG